MQTLGTNKKVEAQNISPHEFLKLRKKSKIERELKARKALPYYKAGVILIILIPVITALLV